MHQVYIYKKKCHFLTSTLSEGIREFLSVWVDFLEKSTCQFCIVLAALVNAESVGVKFDIKTDILDLI